MSTLEPLSAEVRALFRELDHAGDLAAVAAAGERSVCGEAGRVQHGTRVRFSLRIADDRIFEVRYRAYGCPYTLATCEWLARRLQGRELASASPGALIVGIGGALDWARELAVPDARLGRLLVVEDALRQALRDATRSLTRR